MSKTHFYRDTWVEVNVDHIASNVKAIIEHLPENVEMMAVVKANAYGHGAVDVAKTALQAGAKILAVAILDEALELRANNIRCPILVLGWTRPKDVQVAIDHDITLTYFQQSWIEEAATHITSGRLSLHLKVDTGMNRVGTKSFEEALQIYEYTSNKSNFNTVGIFTHFATADEDDLTYFNLQYESFTSLLHRFEKRGIIFKQIHTSNSAASIRFPEQTFSQVRVGIAMYGLAPAKEMKQRIPFPLKEAFSLHSTITHVKKIKAGEAVSYGADYIAENDEWIGTVPVGYADGWIRRLGGKSEVLVQGKRVPIVGRVCMDQFMVKLTDEVNIGEKVTLIGEQGNEKITIDEVAERLETINYEVPLMISNRVPRLYTHNS
ncbi:alanine racemase [Lottiidibacillus patelloidae]|uniref:Alanine racemase n=1 Tax=Lottiidibacillus patelloidae TaxID=2670334 RepID=A0A263BPT3_9BACI|nr:alanine racemase [Lottiidibacillus patelloidae]OZM55765.1 alanine racemase [Lottiidibacillus patelloidae]